MKKTISLFLVLALLAMSFVGCAQTAVEEPAPAPDATTEEAVEPEVMLPKVALVLNGPVSDMGWNASGLRGLQAIEKEFGAEIAYKENVQTSDMEEAFRAYAEAGYGVVMGHGSQFTDAIKIVAESYPDVKFVLINGSEGNGTNISSVQVADEQQGYVMGAIATLLTKTGTVGMIGGSEIPPIKKGVVAFSQGVAETSARMGTEVKALSAMTGSFDDVAKAKEVAMSMADQGADLLGGLANQAGLGIIEGAKNKGVLAIGANTDQFEAAPDTVVVSVQKDVALAYTFSYGQVVDGTFAGEVTKIGVKEGIIFLSPWHDFEDKVSQEVKDELQKIMDEIAAGTIVVKSE